MPENPVNNQNTKNVIEALLFASEKPLLLEQIKKVLDDMDTNQIRQSLEELKSEYDTANRGIRICEVAGGFQMIANPYFVSFLKKLLRGPKANSLSKPALETLAIVAYKQPVTRLEIESLRKVNVDSLVNNLVEKNLIRVGGHKKAPGNPKVYGTTREFLEYFGLKSLEELPKIECLSTGNTTLQETNEVKNDGTQENTQQS
jgi:segregation and condensation protein B